MQSIKTHIFSIFSTTLIYMKIYFHFKTFHSILRSVLDSFLKNKFRLLLLPLVFVLLKIFSALWLTQRLDERDLISIFHGWDSFYYVRIASTWYPTMPSEIWAFFPFYPFCSYVVNLLLHNYLLSTAIVSFLVGLMWLPIYQSIAERYMTKVEAFSSTCIFAIFPHVFIFTTVAYSESLFLFLTLTTWFLYLRGRIFGSSILACLTTLTRPYGILIILPIFFGLLNKKLWKRIPLVTLPVFTLLGWMWYGFMKTGDFLVFLSAQEHWILMPWQPKNWLHGFLLPQFGIDTISQAISAREYGVYMFLTPLIAIFACLILMSFEIDWKLGIYGFATLIVILLYGSPLSVMRFLPFIFPLWLNIKVRNLFIMLALCAFLYLHSLIIWFMFSNNVWIG